LNSLESQVNVSNQSVVAAAANYSAARAVVREIRSQYFPIATAGADITNARISVVPEISAQSGATYTEYEIPIEATWEPDLWGRVRNNVRSAVFTAQSDEAILENVRLAMHAQLAMDYFQLRAQDSLADVLDLAIATQQQTLDLTIHLMNAGLQTDEAVSAAEAQLRATQALRDGVRITRAQYEHAIALLVGKAPADLSIPVAPLNVVVPDIPAGVPAALLQRRPDIASSERSVAAPTARSDLPVQPTFRTSPSPELSASLRLASPTGSVGQAASGRWGQRSLRASSMPGCVAQPSPSTNPATTPPWPHTAKPC
jgi:outer membrane protein TolC